MADINPMVDDIEIQLANGKGVMINMIDADLMELKWSELNCAYWNEGYAYRTERRDEKRIAVLMHRIIMGRKLGRDLVKGEFVDHIDHDIFNNRRSNLRICTTSQNSGNSRLRKNNKTGYKGVCLQATGKYKAALKSKLLGYFDTPEEAYEAYKKAAIAEWGEFANV